MSEQNSTIQTVQNNFNEKFIKVDNDKVLNLEFIRWIKKTDECFYICSKMNGCYSNNENINNGTNRVCKSTNSVSYNKLAKLFE